jgi:prepilin-type N-terminal cleavage/methylation domain-containing protein
MTHGTAGSETGFSLIEVLVALALVVVGLLGVASIVALSMQATRDARDRSVATLLATQLIETMQSDPGEPAVSPAGTLETNISGFFDVVDLSGRPYDDIARAPFSPPYVRRWSTGPTAATGEVPAYELSVRVLRASQRDGGGTRRSTSVLLTSVRRPR